MLRTVIKNELTSIDFNIVAAIAKTEKPSAKKNIGFIMFISVFL